MNDKMLERKLDLATIHDLYQNNLLSDEAYKQALSIVRPRSDYFDWAKMIILCISTALILSGIIFFFAYNWADIGKFSKFGILQIAILACVFGASRRERDSLSSKTLTLSASVLVGVLLAVFGQTYQTGADAFELFFAWSALIFLWAIHARFTALWYLFLAIFNTAVITFWLQVADPGYDWPDEALCVTLTLINGGALAIYEKLSYKNSTKSPSSYFQSSLLIAALISITVPVSLLIFDFDDHSFLNIFIWLIPIAGLYHYYRYKVQELQNLAFICLNLSFVFLSLLFKILIEPRSYRSEEFTFILFALIILGTMTYCIHHLRQIAKSIKTEKGA